MSAVFLYDWWTPAHGRGVTFHVSTSKRDRAAHIKRMGGTFEPCTRDDIVRILQNDHPHADICALVENAEWRAELRQKGAP